MCSPRPYACATGWIVYGSGTQVTNPVYVKGQAFQRIPAGGARRCVRLPRRRGQAHVRVLHQRQVAGARCMSTRARPLACGSLQFRRVCVQGVVFTNLPTPAFPAISLYVEPGCVHHGGPRALSPAAAVRSSKFLARFCLCALRLCRGDVLGPWRCNSQECCSILQCLSPCNPGAEHGNGVHCQAHCRHDLHPLAPPLLTPL